MDLHCVPQTIQSFRISLTDDQGEYARAYLYLIKNDLHPKPYGFIEDVFVAEHARGHGAGTALVNALIAEAKKHSCYKLVATSRLERNEIHLWYLKRGFKEYGKEFRMDF